MSAVLHIEFMDKDEARRLTDQINAKSSDLWALLKDANERKAWAALGYKSWRDYAVKEFKVSQSRAYQLLDQSGVVTAIQEAANSTVVEISERAAREIKPFVKEVAQEIKEKVAKGADPVTTTYEVIEAKRVESKPSKILPRPEPKVPEKQDRTAELLAELHESQDNARELAESLEAYTIAEEGVEAAAKEIKRLQGQLRTVESQRDQYMTKCSELVKTVKALERKIAKLESGK